MPVRSLSSPVFKWPDAAAVDRALRSWAHRIAAERSEVRRIGYFGSYARGDWGVGSDLDVIIIVTATAAAFERRAVEWDLTGLPVPADALVYTEDEWRALGPTSRFRETVEREAVWVLG